MACLKPYGLRRVYLSKEDVTAWKECRASAVEVPSVMAEHQVVDENSGTRVNTATTRGNLNELTGTITITLPSTASDFASRADLELLFYAAGFVKSAGKYKPLNTGACGSTIKMYCVDRTGLLGEYLTGIIVTSIDVTCNNSDAPTISFAYQAADKVECWATALTDDLASGAEYLESGTGISLADGFGGADWTNLPFVADIGGESISLVSSDADYVYFGSATTQAHTTGDAVTIQPPALYTAITAAPLATSRDWRMDDNYGNGDFKFTGATLNVETGMSYGDRIAGSRGLSEVLFGTINATMTGTLYVEATTHPQISYAAATNSDLGYIITINSGADAYSMAFSRANISGIPDLSLAKDAPATADITISMIAGSSGFDNCIVIG